MSTLDEHDQTQTTGYRVLMHGQSHYRIKGIRSGGLMLAKAELVDDTSAALPDISE